MLRSWLECRPPPLSMYSRFRDRTRTRSGGEQARRGCLLANTAMELSMSTAEVAAEARRSYAQPLPCWSMRYGERSARATSPSMSIRKTPPMRCWQVSSADCPRRVGQDPAALSITAETCLNGLLPKP